METIHLNVLENSNQIPLGSEQIRVVEAVSPSVALERVSEGVTITVRDLHGEHSETVYDGSKGDKGDTGDPGYTPVRGVDYWTDADKQIVSTQAEEAAEATAATMLSDPEYKASIKGDPGEPGYTPIKGIDYFDGAKGDTGPKGDPGDDYILTAADKEEIAQQAEELLAPVLDTKAPAIWEDASGAIATFADGADDMPLRECVVQIEPVQAGSGDPSPDNVRAISGWTGVNLTLSPTTDAEDGQTYSISFGSTGTVYGGSLDVVRGTLTVDRAMVKISELEWSYIASYAYMNTRSLDNIIARPTSATIAIDGLLCSAYKTATAQQVGSGNVNGTIAVDTFGAMRIKDNSYTDPDEWKTTQGNQTIVYPLATPITYTLTPQEIRTLLGTNNIWADTGDTAVTYPADTKMFVEKNTPESPVQDVQVNGVSVLSDGVANVPVASSSNVGVVRALLDCGTIMTGNAISIYPASDSNVKNGANGYRPIVPGTQHESTFYGLAKAAGSNEKNSTLPVGQYTESAKSAISEMLNGSVAVTGSTPTITALPGIRYICGEVSTLDITLPASGCVDVVFTSGSTPTVLTITPPTGVTVRWANGFDPTSLEANTTYEINIKDGLGVAASWT